MHGIGTLLNKCRIKILLIFIYYLIKNSIEKNKEFIIKQQSQIGLKKKNSEDPISEQAKNFIELLLRKDPDERMYPSEILKHAFFKDYDYEFVKNKKLESPLKKLIEENAEAVESYLDKKKSENNLVKIKNNKRRKSTIDLFDKGKNNFLLSFHFLIF